MWIPLLLIVTLFSSARAIVPGACVHNITARPAVCCPKPQGYRHPCGFPTRGICAITVAHRSIKRGSQLDIRIDWPTRLFQSSCRCAGNFWGVDCSECRPGYGGDNCQHRVVYVRRNILSYTPQQRHQWIALLNASRHIKSDLVKVYGLERGNVRSYRPMSIYEALVNIHYFASSYLPPDRRGRCAKPVDLNHNTPTFILWHRLILLVWERMLRPIASKRFGWHNFSMPYWDYTDAKNCSVCTDDFLCVPSTKKYKPFSPNCSLANWTAFCYDSTCNNCEEPQISKLTRVWTGFQPKSKHRSTFPTASEMRLGLTAPQYFDFRKCSNFANYIETGCTCSKGAQMHDLVHNLFPGPMQTTAASPNDPMFLLHHTQLDRLLQRWYLIVKPTADEIPEVDYRKPQICRRCGMVGFLPTMTSEQLLVDLRELGVDYDSLTFGPISEDERIRPAPNGEAFNRVVCGSRDWRWLLIRKEGT